MAKSKYISVMLSSRCDDKIVYDEKESNLTTVRKAAKRAIEKIEIGGEKLFKCWINELEAAQEGTEDSWEKCLVEAEDADIVIVIFNGEAGWYYGDAGIGVCHAEFLKAFESAPEKVFLVLLPYDDNKGNKRDKRFREEVLKANSFRSKASNGNEMFDEIMKTLGTAMRKLCKVGVGAGREGKYDIGPSLDWSRLDFTARKSQMEHVLRRSLNERPGSMESGGQWYAFMEGKQVLFSCHAVPSGMSVSAAREMVGQPFLRDHELASHFKSGRIGPIHLIACHKTVSESQAISMLGFPDAIIVETTFGIYIADPIQNVQLMLLRNCRNVNLTQHAVQRAFDWLDRSGEAEYLVARAKSRTRIVQAVAKEVN